MYNQETMASEVVVRKWGNSLGIVLPRDLVDARGIKEDDHILVEVLKKPDFTNLFGSLKTEETGQQFRDRVRKGW